jgi:transcriptional activator SPT7
MIEFRQTKSGEFTTELGEDFFGLRDIGLDSELGLSSLRIPSRLFHGRPKPDADQASEQKIELSYEIKAV